MLQFTSIEIIFLMKNIWFIDLHVGQFAHTSSSSLVDVILLDKNCDGQLNYLCTSTLTAIISQFNSFQHSKYIVSPLQPYPHYTIYT